MERFHSHLAVQIARALNPLITPKYFAKTEVHTALQELVISQLPPYVQSTQHSIYPDVSVIQNDSLVTMPVMQQSIASVEAPMERVIDRPQRQQLRTVNRKVETSITDWLSVTQVANLRYCPT
ncbi:MAG: hypothetical protein AAF639_43710 [Chloroflexota bacterium]